MAVAQTRRLVHGVIAISVSLLLLGSSPSLQARHSIVSVVGYILYLPEYPAMIGRNTALSMSNWLAGRDELNKKIENLSKELEELRIKNSALSALQIRVSHDDSSVPMKEADVILRTPDTWWSEVRINKGKDDGLSVGSPIYGGGFVMGRISAVENSFSWVELLTSSSFMLPVVVEETRDLGIIGGDGGGNVWLHYIPDNRGIKEGMTISTALVGDRLPPGLRIGTISGESVVSPNGFRSMKIIMGGEISRLYSVSFK